MKVLDQLQLNFSTTRSNGIFLMVTPYGTQVKIMIFTQKFIPENLVMISVSKMISFLNIVFSLCTVNREFSENDLWWNLAQNQDFTQNNHP